MKTYLTALLLLALSACGASEAPHSDYFVISFEPARAELPPPGRAALSYATRDADRGTPRAVAIKAYIRSDDTNHDLADQRMKVIADALVEAGVPRKILQLVPQPADPDEFSRLGNGVVVQIERGEPVVSSPPVETKADQTAGLGKDAKFAVAERLLGERFASYKPPGFQLWRDGDVATKRPWREARLKPLPGGWHIRFGSDGVNIGRRYIGIAVV